MREICKAMNLIPVLWDFDSNDFAYGSATSTSTPATFEKMFFDKASTLSNLATAGVVSLEHDLFEKTVAMAPGIIDQVLKTKMIPQSVAECVKDFSPYADKSYVLPNSMVEFKSKSSKSPSTTVIIIIVAVAVAVLVAVGVTLYYMRQRGLGFFRKSGGNSTKTLTPKSSKEQVTDPNRAFVMGPRV